MRRRHASQLAAVFAVVLLVRVLAFDQVGIWGDYGFYQYDARLILRGERPFIDFIGRSPAVVYPYAALVAVLGHPTELVRAYMTGAWLLAALPVYGIARRLYSHWAGLVAVVFVTVTPFAISYSSWAGTQTVAALFAVSAVYVLVRWQTLVAYALAGGLLALAYQSRRSTITILFAVLLWTAYSRVRYDWLPGVLEEDGDGPGFAAVAQAVGTRAGALVAVWFVGISTVYALVAGFDPELTYALFEIHTINLFFSYGRGGYPLVGMPAPLVTNGLGDNYIPVFNDLCQMCGAWTARTFAKTLFAGAPVLGLGWFYGRDVTDHYFTEATFQYLYGILGALALYAIGNALLAGFLSRALVIVAFALFVVAAYRLPAPDRSQLYGRHSQLLVIILCGLAAGYLYRRRVLHAYYFMDFWPYLSILGGGLLVAGWRRGSRHGRVLLALAVVLATVGSFYGAYPLTVVLLNDNEAGWFTMGNIHDYEQDINARTDPGDIVFATNPTYVATSDARLPMDRSRTHMVGVRYRDQGPGASQYQQLNAQMRNGTIRYIVFSATTDGFFRWNESAEAAFKANYCRVESADQLYNRTNAMLYEYTGNTSCPDRLAPTLNTGLKRDSSSTRFDPEDES